MPSKASSKWSRFFVEDKTNILSIVHIFLLSSLSQVKENILQTTIRRKKMSDDLMGT